MFCHYNLIKVLLQLLCFPFYIIWRIKFIIFRINLWPKHVNITAIFTTAPTITFNPNGGSVSPTYAQVGTDRKLASLPTATWAGHNCIGWFTQPAGGDEVTENTEFTSNTTIYAHWENATAAPTITTTSLPNGTVGEAYSQQLQASGGSGELSWEITSVTPPPFLS